MIDTKGILYLVSTPIGNLKDITLRALEILKYVDIIYAEDTRNSIKLLNHYNIKNKLLSLHKFNEKQKLNEIVNNLNEGKNLALISDAGSPLISDPGVVLIPELLKLNTNIVPVVGASAIIPAAQLSGLVEKEFLFMGFFPEKNKDLDIVFSQIENLNFPVFFYASCHKINKNIESIINYFGDINIIIVRELTKKFEERIENKASKLIKMKFKGEIVLAFYPPKKEKNYNIDKLIKTYKKEGFSNKDISKIISIQTGINKKIIYKKLLQN